MAPNKKTGKRQSHNTHMIKFASIFILLLFSFLLSAQCVEGDCVNGDGRLINLDSNIYVGSFSDGKLEGKGVCYFSWGARYVGEWSNGFFNGEGTYFYTNGKIETGIWKDGLLVEQQASSNEAPSKFHAIVVGINNYESGTLRFTDNDARSVYHFLKTGFVSGHTSGDIRLLFNSGATVEKFKESLENIKSLANPNDVFMFFFFGKGEKEEIILANGFIRFDELAEELAKLEMKEKLCFLDYSSVKKDKEEEQLFVMKGDDVLPTQKKTNGSSIIYLNKEGETSIESDGLRFGVMKHYLMEGLRGAADKNFDGALNSVEIHEYVTKKVRDYSEGFLEPILLTN